MAEPQACSIKDLDPNDFLCFKLHDHDTFLYGDVSEDDKCSSFTFDFEIPPLTNSFCFDDNTHPKEANSGLNGSADKPEDRQTQVQDFVSTFKSQCGMCEASIGNGVDEECGTKDFPTRSNKLGDKELKSSVATSSTTSSHSSTEKTDLDEFESPEDSGTPTHCNDNSPRCADFDAQKQEARMQFQRQQKENERLRRQLQEARARQTQCLRERRTTSKQLAFFITSIEACLQCRSNLDDELAQLSEFHVEETLNIQEKIYQEYADRRCSILSSLQDKTAKLSASISKDLSAVATCGQFVQSSSHLQVEEAHPHPQKLPGSFIGD
jgi:hypothetical protein